MLHSLETVYERGERGTVEAYIRNVDKTQMMKVELQTYAGLDHSQIWEYVEKYIAENGGDMHLAYNMAETIDYDTTAKWFNDAIKNFSENSPAL